ncbi:acid-sensing ion channel 1-like [Saccoglossus kowalevskii]|uniref:Acid-sensing ion channel 1-like n=1 Tax=Saccoglossus kowalevskii TaxID=10224 RepID=A0ABM0MEL4_SACKO|nr:PREDICTED: acid-sensing ion channel 1-like [Saccoglossus kowalevskii]
MEAWTDNPGYVSNGADEKKTKQIWTTFHGSKSTDKVADIDVDSKNLEKEEKNKKYKALVRQRFEEFATETTLHGMKYVINSKHGKLRRVIWSIIVLSMLVVFTYSTINSFVRYGKYNVSTVIQINYVSDLTFPAVTLCNYNQYRKSVVNSSGEEFLKLLFPTTGNSSLTENIDWSFFNFTGFNMTQTAIASAHQIEEMLVWCKWRNSIECGPGDFKQILTDFGICYTFNGGSNPLKIQQTGSTNGLYLRLNVQQDEYTNNENTGAGFKVLVHPQGQDPMVKLLGFAVSPGFETLVSMRYTKLHSLGDPYPSNCSEKKLKFFDTYTRQACIAECFSDRVVAECGCMKHTQPGAVESCNPKEWVQCADPVIKNVSLEENACNCPVSCHQSIYEAKVSSTYWPAAHILKEVGEIFNLSDPEGFVRKNYLDVWFYFQELSFEEIIQEEAYSASTLQSDIGGFLGLFLGASLVTVGEFMDFLWIFCMKKYNISRGKT